MKWEAGEIKIAVPEATDVDVAEQNRAFNAGEQVGETKVVRAMICGPLAVHEINEVDSWGWVLTHVASGGAIKIAQNADAFWDMVDLAEKLAGLDWSGPISQFVARNSAAVVAAMRELGLAGPKT